MWTVNSNVVASFFGGHAVGLRTCISINTEHRPTKIQATGDLASHRMVPLSHSNTTQPKYCNSRKSIKQITVIYLGRDTAMELVYLYRLNQDEELEINYVSQLEILSLVTSGGSRYLEWGADFPPLLSPAFPFPLYSLSPPSFLSHSLRSRPHKSS